MSRDTDIKRIIPLKEVAAAGYEDIAELAVIFNHHVIETADGIWRWKPNSLMVLIVEDQPVFTPPLSQSGYGMHSKSFRASIDLNTLTADLSRERFSLEEMMKFSMQTGYSLSGFIELYGQHKLGSAETAIDKMLRMHKGQVLKL